MIEDYSSEDFQSILDFFLDLDEQSKIIISLRLMEGDYDYILDIIESD